MKKFLFLLSLPVFCMCQTPQQSTELTNANMSTTRSEVPAATSISQKKEKPKLVVGITVDQMRYDYITRYWDDYGSDGFKRLINEGYFFKNHHFSYTPTYTGPGHASIYTGTTPAYHGIIANNWYIRSMKREIYCTEDSTVSGVGTMGPAGQMSPRNMISSTMTDQLRLSSNMRSKVIGVSLKDRGAILPAGHSANAAYWFVGGNWVSSDYYMSTLPAWVQNYNDGDGAEKRLATNWNLLRDESTYDESAPDNNPYESPFRGTIKPTFPYDLSALAPENGGIDILKATPYGNELVAEFAKLCIEKEQLGKGAFTDFITVSFSSTDYVGHQFGPQSREAQDTYLRLDLELASLLSYLDDTIGEGEYLVFLTADHGASPVPNYALKHKIPGGYWNPAPMEARIDSIFNEDYGTGKYVEYYCNEQIYLNKALLAKKGISLREASEKAADIALSFEGVQSTYTHDAMSKHEYLEGMASTLQLGFSQKFSGEVILVLEPNWMLYGPTGTTHGSGYNYDTHVPFLIYGSGIKHGQSYERSEIRDIAPTVCQILGIEYPNACTGTPLFQVLD